MVVVVMVVVVLVVMVVVLMVLVGGGEGRRVGRRTFIDHYCNIKPESSF